MANVVKMCDMNWTIVAKVFEMLNSGNVQVKGADAHCVVPFIVTDVEPQDLTYPEGWYYARGCLRNKHTSTTGIYEEIYMVKSNGDFWENTAKYCTLD